MGQDENMDLKKALKNNEFHVRYQPQMNMYTGEMIGAEALIRLKKQDGVVISPALFIPALEKTGGILELDEEVLKIVCSDIINAAEEGIQVPPISVNLSRLHMGRPDTADRLKKLWRAMEYAKIYWFLNLLKALYIMMKRKICTDFWESFKAWDSKYLLTITGRVFLP